MRPIAGSGGIESREPDRAGDHRPCDQRRGRERDECEAAAVEGVPVLGLLRDHPREERGTAETGQLDDC